MRGGAGRASFRGLPQLTRPGAAACVAASGALAKSTRRALAARDKWGSRSPTIGARDRCGRSEMAPGQAHGEDRCSARCCRVPAREHLRRAGIRDRSLEPLVGVFRPAGDHQSRETVQLRVKKVAFLRSWHWPSPLEVPSEGTHHRKGRTLLRPGTESSNPSPSSEESVSRTDALSLLWRHNCHRDAARLCLAQPAV